MFSRSLLRRPSLRDIVRTTFQLWLLAVMTLGYLTPQVYAAAFDGILLRDNTFAQTGISGLNNYVVSTALQSDGKIILGGGFTTYKGTTATRIIRLNTDGTQDTSFVTGTGFNNTVWNIAVQSDGKILVGGEFTTYKGATANRIIRLNTDGTQDTSFVTGTGLNVTTRSIAVQSDGKILVGGDFTTYKGATAKYLIRLNANGTQDTSFVTGTGFNGSAENIVLQSDGKILVGGTFTSYNGTTANRIIRLNANGTQDTSFVTGTGFSLSVYRIVVQSDGKILVGGSFTSYNGTTATRIIRLNTDGTQDTSLVTGTGFSATVRSIAVQSDGKILVGGDFTSYNGSAPTRLIRLNTDGTQDTSFVTGTGFNSNLYSVVLQSDGKILVGGTFTSYDIPIYYSIRLNTNGSRDTSFEPKAPGLNNAVHSIAVQSDGKILVGGDFTTYSGATATRIIRLNANGTHDTSFVTGTGFNNTVRSIVVQSDGKILIGGDFTTYSGATANRIIRLNTDGTQDTSLVTGTGLSSGSATSIVLQSDGKILVGGTFVAYNGITARKIIRLNANGTHDTSFATGALFSDSAGGVYSIVLQSDGKILVGGDFYPYSGSTANRIIRLNANGTQDTSFGIGTGFLNGNPVTIALQSDGKILVGGTFTSYNGVTATRIIRLNTDGTQDTSLVTGTGFSATVRSIVVQSDGKILVGGDFGTYNGSAANSFSRLNTDGTIDTSFNTVNKFNNYVRSIAVQSDGKILAGGGFTTFDGQPASYHIRFSSNSFCSTVTGIPSAECDALHSIYVNTNGPAWNSQSGWGVSTTPCSWSGVSCSGGHVYYLYLYWNNVSGNFAITNGNLNSLQVLYLDGSYLTSFNGAGLGSLYYLSLYYNYNGQLSSFDGSALSSLYDLNLYYNGLTSFDPTGMSSLQTLNLSSNQLSSFDGTVMSSLQSLDLSGNQFTSSSNITGISNPHTLYLTTNQLSSFDGTGMTNLSYLDLGNNQFTSQNDITGVSNLQYLYLQNNQLSSFDGSNTPNLNQLYLSMNQLTSFDGSSMPYLNTVDLGFNLFTSQNDITGVSNLQYLSLYNNQLTSFDGTGMYSLNTLDLSGNQLTSFSGGADMSYLSNLYLNENQLPSFDGTGMTNLYTLDTSYNWISSIDPALANITGYMSQGNASFDYNCLSRGSLDSGVVGWLDSYTYGWENINPSCPVVHPICATVTDISLLECEALMDIYDATNGPSWNNSSNWGSSTTVCDTWYGVSCSGGHVYYLYLYWNNVSGNFAITNGNLNSLQVLYLDGSYLTSFNGAGLGSLYYLSLYYNYNGQLSSFDGSALSSLYDLNLGYNGLTYFDSTGMSNLYYLYLYGNQLNSFDGSSMYSLNTLDLSGNQFTSQSNITGVSNLYTLYLSYNQLSSFDGSSTPYLQNLDLSGNQFTSQSNITGVSNLYTLYLSYNQLSSFDGTGMSSIQQLDLSYNSLTSFSVGDMSSLQYLYLPGNLLRSFDATGMGNLYQIDLTGNLLYSLSPSITTTNTQYQGAASFDYNCLSRSYMDTLGVSSWLDSYTYGWENQNGSCPVGHPVCFGVTDVSFDECEALMSIYDTTGGSAWTRQDNWGVSTTVCNTWYGVSCSTNGHVNSINLDGNNLLGYFEIIAGNLNFLQSLALPFNQLTSFDGTGMTNLLYLNLGNNLLSSFAGIGMNLLQEINLSDNQLTSFSSRGLSALEELDLSYNSLPSFSGSGLDSLTTLYLQTNRLTSFSGVGLRSIQYINMNDNLLPTFNGAGMGTLETIDLTMNKLTSFIPTGMTSLQNLYLDNNQLTSLPASIVNLSNLSWLNVSANLISSLPAEITTIDYLTDFYTQSNCLTGDSLSTSVSSWLNENASDDWTDRNPACPALPNTMYFCGELVLGGTSNWDTSINWKSDVSCKTPAPKNRPDASDNVIILTDVSENSGAPASVKTLEVRDDAIISRPITNGEGGITPLTTTLDGANNDITWTAANPYVSSIEYAKPADVVETMMMTMVTPLIVPPGDNPIINPTTYKIIIIPGTKARIVVSGSFVTSDNGQSFSINSLLPTGTYGGKIYWSSDGLAQGAYRSADYSQIVYAAGQTRYYLEGRRGMTDAVVYSSSTNLSTTDDPSTLVWNSPGLGVGTPIVNHGISSASQVIAAVAANPTVAALISGSLAPGNDGTGAIMAMSNQTFSEAVAETYITPMSFLDTSINNTGNILTGDANFACTAQNQGVVTGTSTFTQCDATTAPTTTSAADDTTPTFTGLCAPNTLVTLYYYNQSSGDAGCPQILPHPPGYEPLLTSLIPSALCSVAGTYSITTNLAPADECKNTQIIAKQSNRKGPTFGASNPSSPALKHTVSCANGQVWNGIACSTICTTTEAPSELKANIDKPYISCTKGGSFKYRISDPNNPAFTPIVSGPFSQGTRALYEGVLPESGVLTYTNNASFQIGTGFNDIVNTIALQPDGKILVGGVFSTYNKASAPKIIRLNADGTPDTSFQTGTGFNYTVQHLILQPDGKILVGGSALSTYNGVWMYRIIRLNDNGTRESSFSHLNMASGQLTGLALQPDGKILVSRYYSGWGGSFQIIRFNADGTPDSPFAIGSGTGGLGITFTSQPDGKILVSGDIWSYGGESLLGRIMRLNANGTRDTSFQTGTGLDSVVTTIALQPDGKILVGGNFLTYNGASAPHIIRLNADGTHDISFQTGTGFNNSFVTTIALQPDGKILVGGGFSTYNDVSVNRIARIHSGNERGGHKVECLYSSDNDNYTVADECTKTMIVRAATPGDEVQGCSSIDNYYENTTASGAWIQPTAFNATLFCNTRKLNSATEEPFRLGVDGIYEVLGYLSGLVGYDQFTSDLTISTFDSGLSKSLVCAVKVGDGYSTNSMCERTACGGSGCALPNSYLITPTNDQLFCSKEEEISYTIGCASGNTYAACLAACVPNSADYDDCMLTPVRFNLYTDLDQGTFTKDLIFRVDGVEETVPRVMTCTSATPQTNDVKTPHCTVSLPTGKELAFKIGESEDDIAQYQTIYDIVPFDNDPPTATIDASDPSLDESPDHKRLSSTIWLNKPIMTTITCQNVPVEDNNTCTCAWIVKASMYDDTDTTQWRFSSLLRDIVNYQRVIRDETILGQSFYVLDNADNLPDDTKSKVTISLGVDMTYPSVTGTEVEDPLNESNRIVTLTATDNLGGSGLWGEDIRAVVVNKGGESKAIFDESCNLELSIPEGTEIHSSLTNITTPFYAPFPGTGAGFVTSPYTLPTSYNPLIEKIVYCVQDNAKNQLVGTYPFNPDALIGCFSDGSQQPIPNLDEGGSFFYKTLLINRFDLGKYGYELTDSAKSAPMTDFRTKLMQNIETFVKQQYCPTTTDFTNLRIDIGEKIISDNAGLLYAARGKEDGASSCPALGVEGTTARNNNGYYYFKREDDVGSTQTLEFSGVPRLSGSKVVVVEGADIYIRGNIHYMSRESSLVIIALKDSAGNGGNIYVHPQVTNIDGTLIADGALMNGELNGDKNMIAKIWFNDSSGELRNPLTINGRLLTHNTRGGSLYKDGSLLGVKLSDKNTGMCALNTASSPLLATCNILKSTLPVQDPPLEALDVAGLQDLERFRVVSRVAPDSNNRCTLHVTGVLATNRPDILSQVRL